LRGIVFLQLPDIEAIFSRFFQPYPVLSSAMDKIRLIYDGDCPFCSKYAQLVRFREAVGEVQMLNAREHPEVVNEMKAKGVNLDKGMALTINDNVYHGADAVNRIALMSTGSGAFNAFTAAVFKSRLLSKTVYPVLKVARKAALLIKGKKGID
jgi:predicted DCC family thiol-disulfide oxidoreductase YuxK